MRYQVYFYCLLCRSFLEFGSITVNVNNVHSDPKIALQEAARDYQADRKKENKEAYVTHLCLPGEPAGGEQPPPQMGIAVFAGLRRM